MGPIQPFVIDGDQKIHTWTEMIRGLITESKSPK
jgi:hypothetical protein